MDDASWNRSVILLPKTVICSYPRALLTASKCIFKSFPFTLTHLRLARVFNMPVCFPCHFRRFITAKCPWKKSLEYQCSLLWERPTLSLNCSSAQDMQVRDLMAVLREKSVYCQASKSSPVQRGGGREKKVDCQTACSQSKCMHAACKQQIMRQWIIDFLRNWYFILIL